MSIVARNLKNLSMQQQTPETLCQATNALMDCATAHNATRETAALSFSIAVLFAAVFG
ncbi:MAG TPA: hypothetical protein VFC84_09290 [Desulfosporosinus sp.]|nr:hypothetical protein [Desulfosporosinus sp.]